MAIRKFTQLNPSSWDVLDRMLKLQKDNSYKTIYEVPEDVNVVYVEIQRGSVPMRRGFCRCGHSYMVKEDNKGNLIYNCPVCGNNKIFRTSIYHNSRELGNIKRFEVSTGKVSFIRESFIVKESVIDTEIEISSSMILDAEATETEFKPINSQFKDYPFNDFISTAPFKYEHIDSYFKFLREVGFMNSGYSELIELLKANKKCPNIMKDFDSYPYLATYTSFTECPDTDDKTTLEEIITDFIKCPKEYRPLINKMFEGLNPREYGYYSYRRSSTGFLKERLAIFLNWDEIKTTELKQSMNYIIRHSSINAFEIKSMLDDIKRYAFSKEEEKFLAKHLLANFVSQGTRSISQFRERIQFLTTNGYLVSEENLDKRNFNLLRNVVRLKEDYGYSDERISLFCDAFDLNPMSAIQYLESKKNPSKKLKQEIEEKMDKKYS